MIACLWGNSLDTLSQVNQIPDINCPCFCSPLPWLPGTLSNLRAAHTWGPRGPSGGHSDGSCQDPHATGSGALASSPKFSVRKGSSLHVPPCGDPKSQSPGPPPAGLLRRQAADQLLPSPSTALPANWAPGHGFGAAGLPPGEPSSQSVSSAKQQLPREGWARSFWS